MDYRTQITANGTYRIAQPDAVRSQDRWFATVMISSATASLGGATVSLFASPDGGTTLIPETNSSGVAFVATANAMTNVNHGFSRKLAPSISLYVTVTGYTAPINIDVFDNE